MDGPIGQRGHLLNVLARIPASNGTVEQIGVKIFSTKTFADVRKEYL